MSRFTRRRFGYDPGEPENTGQVLRDNVTKSLRPVVGNECRRRRSKETSGSVEIYEPVFILWILAIPKILKAVPMITSLIKGFASRETWTKSPDDCRRLFVRHSRTFGFSVGSLRRTYRRPIWEQRLRNLDGYGRDIEPFKAVVYGSVLGIVLVLGECKLAAPGVQRVEGRSQVNIKSFFAVQQRPAHRCRDQRCLARPEPDIRHRRPTTFEGTAMSGLLFTSRDVVRIAFATA